MSPVEAIFVPFLPKVGTKPLHSRPPQSLNGSNSVLQSRHSGYMRDGLDGGGRFIPDDIVGVHTLSLLAASREAHDHATDNYTQHNTQTKTLRTSYTEQVTRGYGT